MALTDVAHAVVTSHLVVQASPHLSTYTIEHCFWLAPTVGVHAYLSTSWSNIAPDQDKQFESMWTSVSAFRSNIGVN